MFDRADFDIPTSDLIVPAPTLRHGAALLKKRVAGRITRAQLNAAQNHVAQENPGNQRSRELNDMLRKALLSRVRVGTEQRRSGYFGVRDHFGQKIKSGSYFEYTHRAVSFGESIDLQRQTFRWKELPTDAQIMREVYDLR